MRVRVSPSKEGWVTKTRKNKYKNIKRLTGHKRELNNFIRRNSVDVEYMETGQFLIMLVGAFFFLPVMLLFDTSQIFKFSLSYFAIFFLLLIFFYVDGSNEEKLLLLEIQKSLHELSKIKKIEDFSSFSNFTKFKGLKYLRNIRTLEDIELLWDSIIYVGNNNKLNTCTTLVQFETEIDSIIDTYLSDLRHGFNKNEVINDPVEIDNKPFNEEQFQLKATLKSIKYLADFHGILTERKLKEHSNKLDGLVFIYLIKSHDDIHQLRLIANDIIVFIKNKKIKSFKALNNCIKRVRKKHINRLRFDPILKLTRIIASLEYLKTLSDNNLIESLKYFKENKDLQHLRFLQSIESYKDVLDLKKVLSKYEDIPLFEDVNSINDLNNRIALLRSTNFKKLASKLKDEN